MIEFTNQVYVGPQQDDDTTKNPKQFHNKIFPGRYGIGWAILRSLAAIVFCLCHLIVAIIFITFYVSAMTFFITVTINMALEMVSPTAPRTNKKDVVSAGLFFLLLGLFITACVILSLFWVTIKAALFNRCMVYQAERTIFVVCLIIGSGIWVAVESSPGTVSFPEYVMTAATLSWYFAFACCVGGAVLHLIFVFTKSAMSSVAVVAVLITLVVVNLWSSLVTVYSSSNGVIGCVVAIPILVAIFLLIALFRGCTKDRKGFICHKGTCLFFFGLFFAVVLSTLYLSSATTCSGKCRDAQRRSLQTIGKIPYNPSLSYTICKKTWTNDKINIGELAFLANLTYNQAVECWDATRAQEMANNFFKGRSVLWKVKIYTKSYQQIVHLQHKTTHIIAIRGPVTTVEYARNAKLWVEIGVMKAVGSILPLLNHFPDGFISWYARQTAVIQRMFQDWSHVKAFQEIEDLVKETNTNNNEVILVGHSLAGGIAKIIGARQQLPAVSFSSPGIAYGHSKFGFSLEDAFKTVVSISPQNDVFSMLDKNAGIEQRIKCNAKASEQCHLISMTYCELHNACGQGTAECEWMMDN